MQVFASREKTNTYFQAMWKYAIIRSLQRGLESAAQIPVCSTYGDWECAMPSSYSVRNVYSMRPLATSSDVNTTATQGIMGGIRTARSSSTACPVSLRVPSSTSIDNLRRSARGL